MYQDDFCGRNSELLSRRFLQKSQIYKYITHSPEKFHYFFQITFCPVLISVTSRPRANIRGGGRKETQVKGRTDKRKMQEFRKSTRKVTLSM